MKKKPSIFTKPSTTIACVAFAGLLAAGVFLGGCGTPASGGDHDLNPPGQENLSNVASAAQGRTVPETQGEVEQSRQAQTDGSEQPIPEPVDSQFEAWQKPMQSVPSGALTEDPVVCGKKPDTDESPCRPPAPSKSVSQIVCGLPLAPQSGSKIDITKCESYTSVPFRVTDAKGNPLEVEVFPEYWGGAVHCTVGHRYAFEHKFQDSSKQPDKIADHSLVTFDFGNYVPKEVRVTRDTGTYDSAINTQEGIHPSELPAVSYDVTTDCKYVFEADFQNANTVYYVISAKWDESHNVDYAIAVRKA